MFQSKSNEVALSDLANVLNQIESENIKGVQQVVPLSALPPQQSAEFFSDDQTTALIPLTFDSSLETKEIQKSINKIHEVVEDSSNFQLYLTGPAGIGIMLISRFQEEQNHHSVREAVEIAVSNTGGVISSAGIILAATFAVLMTQPVELLFVFGFIVAVGILLDTFLIRGILLPGLIVLLEKDKTANEIRK